MRVVFELSGLDRAADDLLAALDDEVPAGLLLGAEIVADDARRQHPYTDRTGTLTANTVPGAVTGRLTSDSLAVEVVAETPYASFVDEGTGRMEARPFLAPAYERRQDAVAAEVDRAMESAARRAGW